MGCCVIITGKTHTIIVGFEDKKTDVGTGNRICQ